MGKSLGEWGLMFCARQYDPMLSRFCVTRQGMSKSVIWIAFWQVWGRMPRERDDKTLPGSNNAPVTPFSFSQATAQKGNIIMPSPTVIVLLPYKDRSLEPHGWTTPFADLPYSARPPPANFYVCCKPRANKPTEDFTSVFQGHADLYIFAAPTSRITSSRH